MTRTQTLAVLLLTAVLFLTASTLHADALVWDHKPPPPKSCTHFCRP